MRWEPSTSDFWSWRELGAHLLEDVAGAAAAVRLPQHRSQATRSGVLASS